MRLVSGFHTAGLGYSRWVTSKNSGKPIFNTAVVECPCSSRTPVLSMPIETLHPRRPKYRAVVEPAPKNRKMYNV